MSGENGAAAYADFLAAKAVRAPERGLLSVPELAAHLYPFQRAAVAFGLRTGSWACFFSTGLGKTAIELEWCRHAAAATNGRALILTPLAVARQIEAEGRRWGYSVRVIRGQDEATDGINVCNYDRLEKLDADAFGAIALDESSIIKEFTGKTSRAVIQFVAGHRFRLSATATPSPNDVIELATHAEALGVMDRAEMLARWFINDSGDTGTWRLKRHGIAAFWDWVASWARMAEHPRDVGDDVPGFDLPPLTVHRHRAAAVVKVDGALFAGAVSATEMHRVKRQTAASRAAQAAARVFAEPEERWIVWTDTDYEADAVGDALTPLGDAVIEVRGSHPIDRKEAALAAFDLGTARIMVSKPACCGWGLNWQHTARVCFVGRSFSYEQWFQAVRRCWRFGQRRPVDVHLIVAAGEDEIGRVLERKATDHARMTAAMVAAMRRAIGRDGERRVPYDPRHMALLPGWLVRG